MCAWPTADRLCWPSPLCAAKKRAAISRAAGQVAASAGSSALTMALAAHSAWPPRGVLAGSSQAMSATTWKSQNRSQAARSKTAISAWRSKPRVVGPASSLAIPKSPLQATSTYSTIRSPPAAFLVRQYSPRNGRAGSADQPLPEPVKPCSGSPSCQMHASEVESHSKCTSRPAHAAGIAISTRHQWVDHGGPKRSPVWMGR